MVGVKGVARRLRNPPAKGNGPCNPSAYFPFSHKTWDYLTKIIGLPSPFQQKTSVLMIKLT